MSLWAKSDGETLQQHILKCLTAWDNLWQANTPAYSHLAKKMGLEAADELYQLVRDTIVCHDLGKGTVPWQRYIRDKSGQGRITHALFSFFLYGEVKEWPRDELFLASALAILGHHQMLHNNVFAAEKFNSIGNVEIHHREMNNLLKDWFPLTKGVPSNIFAYTSVERVQKLKIMVQKFIKTRPFAFKRLYTFLLAILTYVDYLASSGYVSNIKSPEKIWSGFKRSPVYHTPNKLQQKVLTNVENGKKNLLIQGGCGSGKTGAALLACHKLVEKGEVNKLIFTLPTKFTSNSMYWDFTDPEKYNFSPQDVGIYHSEFESLLATEWEGEEEDYIKLQKLLNCWYAKPLNISTIDHLLYSLLHCYRYADRAFGHLQTALIVFDEIHYYDPILLAKIGQCLFILRQLSIPHIIMSATMPYSFQRALQLDSEKSYQLVETSSASKDATRIISLHKEPLTTENTLNKSAIKLISEHISLKQIIVVNQIERAKTVAKILKYKFPNVNIICYHSQFTKPHRELKEKLIKILFKDPTVRSSNEISLLSKHNFANSRQVILVTTQICELSLDISCHVMHSEIAPIDSLIQRAGRLHRRGNDPSPEICQCKTCQDTSFSDYFKYKLHVYPLEWDKDNLLLPYNRHILTSSWSILERSEGILSTKNGVEWVNELYPDEPRLTDELMLTMIMEDLVFGRTPTERYGDNNSEYSQGSFRVREDTYPTVLIIPKQLYSPMLEPEELIKDRGIQISRNRAFAQRDKLIDLRNGIYILDIHYDSCYGLDFLR